MKNLKILFRNIQMNPNKVSLAVMLSTIFSCLVALAASLIDLKGHDYAYFLPRLYDNHLFYLRNGLAIKEYTASFCAGVFEFANPQSLAISIVQFSSALFGPEVGLRISFIFYSLVGGFGLLACARYWGLSRNAATLSGMLVVFGSFLLARVIVGHVTFLNFGLVPAISALLLFGSVAFVERRISQSMLLSGLAVLLIASLVYGGSGVLIPQMALSVFLIIVICRGLYLPFARLLIYYTSILIFALALSAPKLEAMASLLGTLDRSFYPLPGFPLYRIPEVLFHTVFWIPDENYLNSIMKNSQFGMGFHEWSYSVTPFLVPLLVAGFYLRWKQNSYKFNILWSWVRLANPSTIILAVLLLLPILFNLYEENWNEFLKSTPILGSSSNLIRWLCLYSLAICLWVGKIWDGPKQLGVLSLSILAIVLSTSQYVIMKRYVSATQNYDPSVIISAWEQEPPKLLENIGAPVITNADGSKKIVYLTNQDHMFIQGFSNALCYEPLFGYRLEAMNKSGLNLAPITSRIQPDNLNVRNPACYVYPADNQCSPGDNFKVDQITQIQRLLKYGDPSLATSSRRQISNNIALFSILIWLLLMAIFSYREVSLRHRKPSDTSD